MLVLSALFGDLRDRREGQWYEAWAGSSEQMKGQRILDAELSACGPWTGRAGKESAAARRPPGGNAVHVLTRLQFSEHV